MNNGAMPAVIPAAGLGTRMLPMTKCVPKELLPLGGRPVIHHIVEEGIEAGIREFVFVARPGDTRLRDYFARASQLEDALPDNGPLRDAYESTVIAGASFCTVEQTFPQGLGDAVLRAREVVGDRRFAVMLPDMVFAPSSAGLSSLTGIPGDASGLLLMKVESDAVSNYGIASIESEGGKARISGLVEKPPGHQAPSNLAVAGRYVFTPDLFALLDDAQPGADGEIQLTDAIRALAAKSDVLPAILRDATVHDCGSPSGYTQACSAYAG